MKMPKPSEADKEYFRSIVPEHPAVAVKAMFGNLAAFVNGNMFMGLFGPAVGVRLPTELREELSGVEGADVFGPPDRPMKEYVSLPTAWRSDPVQTELWVNKALESTSTLPPKDKK